MPTDANELDPHTPTANSDRTSSKLDLGAIRSILEKDVGFKDIDWLLRDSDIQPNPPKLASSTAKSSSISTPTSASNSNGSPAGGSTTKKPEEEKKVPLSPVSSHLTTGISNANEYNLSKTKPSISPIQEETVAHVDKAIGRSNSVSSQSRRRSSFSSINSAGSASSTGGGFFSRLKDKMHGKKEPSAPSSPVMSPVTPQKQSVFKDNYDLKPKTTPSTAKFTPLSTDSASSPSLPTSNCKLTRTVSTPSYASGKIDPKLDEYIKFYQQRGLRRNSSTGSNSRRASSVSITQNGEKAPLPSALLNGFDNVTYNKEPVEAESPPASSGKLSSFLRRRSNTTLTLSATTEKHRHSSESNISTSVSPDPSRSSKTEQEEILPEFSNLKPLKRVAFHSTTFLIDPPQQIPSRTPRKGNVEVLSNGTLKVNPLSEEDKIAIEMSQKGQGGGLVVGGTGALGLIKKPSTEEANKTEDKEADEPVKTPSSDNKKEEEEDEKVDKHAKSLAIDKPMVVSHVHRYNIPVKKMALDLMYTRCCHLREILPIPAILKQIPKGSMAPLPLLQLRNPTPTMAEIQTFADFIRIAPIICISLDGVSLSLSQFKILLSAMSAKKQLEKLSLRNTPIDEEGWSLLCWFLSRNLALNKLDITQCPSLSVNLLKKRKKKGGEKSKFEEDLVRMTCNRENRSDMDWSLFTATIVARGGIEELILTGCCITDLDVFEKLIKRAVCIKTNRLGLAYNQITTKQVQVVINNWLFLSFVRGLDLGYNDFLSVNYINAFLEILKTPKFEEKLANSSLAFLSLNATNMRFSDSFKVSLENLLLKLPNLKYLDLSNNPRLFGSVSPSTAPTAMKETNSDSSINSSISSNENGETSAPSSPSLSGKLSQDSIISYFCSVLPLFPKLIRFHLENNNLSSASLRSLAQVLPFCKNLGYFSVIGNETDLAAGTALIQALKNSKTLVALDCDYENFPDYYKERIGLYTMRNMEKLLNSDGTNLNKTPAEFSTDTLTDQLNEILAKKAEHKLDLSAPDVVKFIEKARTIRSQLKETMTELFKLQWKNELSLDGKETLIRFAFLDSSIEKGLLLIDSSLADKNEPQDQSSAVFIGASEDEKNKYKIQENERHLAETSLAVPTSQLDSGSTSPMALSRSQSKTSLSNLDRQEGSIMKLLKLHDYHKKNNIFEDFGNLSGEEIRDKLVSLNFSDLDKMIDVLNTLKEKGVSLKEYFTDEKSEEFLVKDRERLDFNAIRQKIEKLTNIKTDSNAPRIIRTTSEEAMNADSANNDKPSDKSNGASTTSATHDDKKNSISTNINSNDNSEETLSEEESVLQEEEMRKTYDEVLSELSAHSKR